MESEPLEQLKLLESEPHKTAQNRTYFMRVLSVLCVFLAILAVLELLELLKPLEPHKTIKTAVIRTAGIAKAARIGTPRNAGIGTAGTAIEKSWNRPCLLGTQFNAKI